MCELFGLSSNRPVALTISLQTFARHGGLEGPHKDGWGVAYYEQHDVRLIKDTTAASESEWVRFLDSHKLRSNMILSHIRKATQGKRTFSNTQPFVRELGGRMHVFAHNGNLKGFRNVPALKLGRYRPVGDTDSEWAFCALLDRLTEIWPGTGAVPDINERLARIARFAEVLRSLGPANFIYGDGDALFAHGHRRTQSNGDITAPGLCVLCRRCTPEGDDIAVDGLTLDAGEQEVALVASVPLTDEVWRPLAEGEVAALRNGRIVTAAKG
jgi:predicted glutamine amidotransferase